MRLEESRIPEKSTYRVGLVFWFLFFLIAFLPVACSEQDRIGNTLQAAESSTENPENSRHPRETSIHRRLNLSEEELREKQKQVQAVVLLFMGVVLLGVLLFATVLLYGSWIRRINRSRPTQIKKRDDLWYLKHPTKKGTPLLDSDFELKHDPPESPQ